jgi:hypothetical protein
MFWMTIKKLIIISSATMSADTSALLLASKSNYQNILEGTHLPGVTYPEALSTNLTSKRTSHKIAEQGRRNRINSALQEIAKLLPNNGRGVQNKDGAGSGDGGEYSEENVNGSGNAPKNSQGPGSKASTVEMAIEYIKQLQKQVDEQTRRAEEAEARLATAGS